MTAISHIFFRYPAAIPESTGAVIDWWESRRAIYNVAVGATGILTLGIMNVMFALPPNPDRMPWQLAIVGPLIYGTLANICFTGGWAAELFLRRYIRDDNGTVGAALFRYGFVFSIGLTLFPAGIATLVWFARVTAAVLR